MFKMIANRMKESNFYKYAKDIIGDDIEIDISATSDDCDEAEILDSDGNDIQSSNNDNIKVNFIKKGISNIKAKFNLDKTGFNAHFSKCREDTKGLCFTGIINRFAEMLKERKAKLFKKMRKSENPAVKIAYKVLRVIAAIFGAGIIVAAIITVPSVFLNCLNMAVVGLSMALCFELIMTAIGFVVNPKHAAI